MTTLKGLACKVVVRDVLDAEEAVMVKRKRLEELERIEDEHEKIIKCVQINRCEVDDCEEFSINGESFYCIHIYECGGDGCFRCFCNDHVDEHLMGGGLCKYCRGE